MGDLQRVFDFRLVLGALHLSNLSSFLDAVDYRKCLELAAADFDTKLLLKGSITEFGDL